MSSPVQDYLKPMERAVIPRFVLKAVPMEFASKQAGRPIFEDREFVEIMVVGERGFTAHEPVNDEHIKRWPEQYAAFKAGRELPTEGVPLAQWPHPQMTPAMIEELAYHHVRTVEQLAGLDDNKIAKLGMGMRDLRKRAQIYLDVAAKGIAPIEKLVSRAENAEARGQVQDQQLADANSEIARLTAELEAAKGKKKEPRNAGA